MSSSGYSGTPLPKKLGIKEGCTVGVFSAPDYFEGLLDPLPAGVIVRHGPRGKGPFDVLIAFVRTEKELAARFERARRLLDPFGGLWVAWPKKTSPLATGLRDFHVRDFGLASGLVDNKVCAVDSDWSGLRFVVRVEDRPPRKRRS